MSDKTYTNGEVTIVWKSELCTHSGNCVRGLPDVFKPNSRPWIHMDAASTDALVSQVNKCPSGALTYFVNDANNEDSQAAIDVRVEVLDKGPLIVKGEIEVVDTDGNVEIKKRSTAFCRCGASANKPYCDGAHNKISFEG